MRIAVTGYSSVPGPYVVAALEAAGHELVLVGRSEPQASRKDNWIRADLHSMAGFSPASNLDALVHLAPLPLLPGALDRFIAAGVSRLVALSTTSRFSKEGSASDAERELAVVYADAEAVVGERCRKAGVASLLVRPTMIYDGYRDANVALVRRLVARFGFFPVVRGNCGLRQPIHARDLARLISLAVDSPAVSGQQALNVGGAETMAYDELVRRVFLAAGARPRILHWPAGFFRGVVRAARQLPLLRKLDPALVDRMLQDLVFDDGKARELFGFSPGGFRIEDPVEDV